MMWKLNRNFIRIRMRYVPIPRFPPSNPVPNNLAEFGKTLNDKMANKYLELARVLLNQMDKYNVTYIASGGTLIGIYRHHGFIPWDDDIDISIFDRQKDLLIEAVSKLNESYSLVTSISDTYVWKFFKLDAYKMDSNVSYKFRYPNIDIFILIDSPNNKYQDNKFPSYIFSNSKTFPLIKRYFNGLMLYSPCDMEFMFKELSYNMDDCVSSHMNHWKVQSYHTRSISCRDLKQYYSFVERQKERKDKTTVIIEKLKLQNQTIHTIKYSIPNKCTDILSFYPSDLNVF